MTCILKVSENYLQIREKFTKIPSFEQVQNIKGGEGMFCLKYAQESSCKVVNGCLILFCCGQSFKDNSYSKTACPVGGFQLFIHSI